VAQQPSSQPELAVPPARKAVAHHEPVAAALVVEARGVGIRSGLILTAAVALVLLVPAAGTIEDRWGQGSTGGRQPFYRTAGILAGGSGGGSGGNGGGVSGGSREPSDAGAATKNEPPSVASTSSVPAPAAPAPPAVALPGGAGSIEITWRTTPPGGRI